MKICFICSEYPPGPHGGIGTSACNLARGLVQAGHEVRVAGIYPRHYPGPEYEENQGVCVWRWRASSVRLGWIADRYRLFQAIRRWAKAGEIDLVDVPDYEGWAAGWPSLPVPVIARWCGSGSGIRAANKQSVSRSTFYLEQASLRRADYHCAKSAYLGAQGKRIFGQEPPQTILHNLIEIPRYPSWDARSTHRVVFSGTLNVNKGIMPLVQAWPRVLAAYPHAELHVFGKDGQVPGGGSMQNHLRSQMGDEHVRDSVCFHGHVERPVLFQHLATARAAVFPSYSEGFANAPVEAMACACPTIISSRSSGPEIVREGIDGLMVDPDRLDTIAEAIVQVLADDGLARRLSEAGRRRVEEKFASSLIVGRNETFYRQCLDDFHRPKGAKRRAPAPEPIAEPVAAQFARANGQELSPAPVEDHAELTAGCSVAICTYRRPASLSRFLDSLAAQDRRPARLVVVDASPVDETEKMLRAREDLDRLADSVFYFRVREPLIGLTRQRNFAARWVDTDLLAFFDDDIVLEPGCLAELERAHRVLGSDLAGAAAFIDAPRHRSRAIWWLRVALRLVSNLRPGTYCRSGMSITWDFLPPGNAWTEGQWLPGGATMWKTAVVRQLGFYEGFRGYCQAEDLEFSLRAARKGKLVLAGAARVLHLHEPSARPNEFQRGYMAIYNRYLIHRRTLEPRTWRDRAWFCYAWTVDTLLLLRHLLVPRRVGPTFRQIAGRIKAACDLIRDPIREPHALTKS